MDGVTGFVGGLFCKIPLGIAACYSASERAIVGRLVIVAAVGMIAFYILMRNPRRELE
ncbi:hypothetical protein SAMN05444161_9054 [Rhizobiales bacterium GAS191]|nr:hypothetical protein SAMN05519104_7551 [Rhizobiales bacterium GAS188]SEF04365.1 hypothetical protein SAMN05519104_8072 [Rhizobiales bacterium GAS188]SEF14783.1 hypothetical protein SAMN05444161_9054 [Rhizobiales bacterium GAS191]